MREGLRTEPVSVANDIHMPYVRTGQRRKDAVPIVTKDRPQGPTDFGLLNQLSTCAKQMVIAYLFNFEETAATAEAGTENVKLHPWYCPKHLIASTDDHRPNVIDAHMCT